MNTPPPITLEAIGLNSWAELYALDSAELVEKLGRVPLHAGDAFIAVMVLRGVADLRKATEALDRSTEQLINLTRALFAVAIISLIVAVLAIFA
jgi:hypothetical protein